MHLLRVLVRTIHFRREKEESVKRGRKDDEGNGQWDPKEMVGLLIDRSKVERSYFW